MDIDLTQLLAQIPIAGAMIWFAYYIVSDARKEREASRLEAQKEREAWAEERKEMYEKISKSHTELSDSIRDQSNYLKQNTKTLEKLIS